MKTYKKIKESFSEERKARITEGANKIREELRILSDVRRAAGLTQEQLAEIMDVKQSYISQVEGRSNITLSTLIGMVSAMGGSIDMTINFPQKKSIQFSQVETLFSNQLAEVK
jgi:transcriptional regulator with XRE-family HTH domain